MNPKSSAIDTGAQLRALYQPQGGVGNIFSPKVADYAASRPDYPAALFDALREAGPLPPGAVVADIGAGTGLLTQGLLAQGYDVTAIEPSAAMRAAADQALREFAHYRSAAGTAEHTPLPDASVDLITAAQAFHWFDVDAARAEFLRVLKPDGQVALIWNDRVLSDPLHTALNALFAKYGGPKLDALLAHEDRGNVCAFFGATVPQQWSWPHAHQLDAAALQSLVFSRSYMPDKDSPVGQQACADVREIFERLADDGVVAVRYTTVAMLGRPQ
jgi:ubiquinone/menaquinone biosynthesis C-methylase UbiE